LVKELSVAKFSSGRMGTRADATRQPVREADLEEGGN
jgi:hypothetical protein